MKLAEGETPKVEKGVEALYENIFEKGMMPKDALGIQESDTESLYAQGYQLYNMGKYKDARNVFASLLMIDPIEPRFMFGHAACSHMLEEYETAADMYTHQAMVSPDDPVPYYHAADCYIKIADPFSAEVALNLVIKRSQNRPEFAMIKERAEMTVKKLSEELQTEGLGGAPETMEPPLRSQNEGGKNE